ncbi:MAG: flagellar biosynthesis protein FlgJ [Rariglobus sp.]
MSISALSSVSPTAEPSWSRGLSAPMGMPSARAVPEQPGAADVKKAAGQFEAIMLRQLLAPSIEPMMSGGLGGSGGGGAGGGVYGYMLTDVLCSSLGASGGLGLGRMLEKQLAPPTPRTADDVSPLSTEI